MGAAGDASVATQQMFSKRRLCGIILEVCATTGAGSAPERGHFRCVEQEVGQEITVNPVITQEWSLKYGQIPSSLLQNGCTSDIFLLRNSAADCQSAALSSENGLEWLLISVAVFFPGENKERDVFFRWS